jgi:hypothetical protein
VEPTRSNDLLLPLRLAMRSAAGMAALAVDFRDFQEQIRPADRHRPGRPRDLRQPLRAQGAGGTVAVGPPAVRAALHADLCLLEPPGASWSKPAD